MTESVVPRHKGDVIAVRSAAALGWPGVEPVVDQLLVWCQDGTWTVSGPMWAFLSTVGRPLAKHLRPILDSDDGCWKYSILCGIVARSSDELVDELRLTLERLRDDPSVDDHTEEVDEVAGEILTRRDIRRG